MSDLPKSFRLLDVSLVLNQIDTMLAAGDTTAASTLVQELRARCEAHMEFIRQEEQNRQRNRRARSVAGLVHQLRFLPVSLITVGLVAAGIHISDDIWSKARNVVITIPLIVAALAFAWGVIQGRYISSVIFTGPAGCDRHFAGVAVGWKVTENNAGHPRLHVYGLVRGARHQGLSQVRIGGTHVFQVTHVVGESPIKAVFALHASDIGLWRLPKYNKDKTLRDTRDRIPEAASLLLTWDSLLDDIEERLTVDSDNEDFLRAAENQAWKPHAEELTRHASRLRSLAGLPN